MSPYGSGALALSVEFTAGEVSRARGKKYAYEKASRKARYVYTHAVMAESEGRETIKKKRAENPSSQSSYYTGVDARSVNCAKAVTRGFSLYCAARGGGSTVRAY